MAQDTCETVKIKCDNAQGYYVCNADSIPEGATIYSDKARRRSKATGE